jgi:hypothetical protein
MSEPERWSLRRQSPWDARLARQPVTPLKDSWVMPNHLTTVRRLIGVAGAPAFTPETYAWSNLAALSRVCNSPLMSNRPQVYCGSMA